MIEIILDSLLLGAVSGLLAGLFGIGGGLIIVPILAMLFTAHGFDPGLVMIMAVATSLATIIFTSISSIYAHHRLGSISWDKVRRLGPGIMIGAVIGAVIADYVAADTLRVFFIAYLIVVAIQLLLQVKPTPGRVNPSMGLDRFIAVLIGLLSAILGIGGGTLIVPYLIYFQTPIRNAVAISSACGLPIALAGTASYAFLGQNVLHLPEWSLGYIHIPSFIGIVLTSIFTAPIGARLANSLPAVQLKRYFSVLLLIMAAKLMWF
ncbi:MAG: sulfite exporter TauE/SafE family protein [Methylosarcina sp.]